MFRNLLMLALVAIALLFIAMPANAQCLGSSSVVEVQTGLGGRLIFADQFNPNFNYLSVPIAPASTTILLDNRIGFGNRIGFNEFRGRFDNRIGFNNFGGRVGNFNFGHHGRH